MINPRLPILLVLFLTTISLFGQILEPAKWSVSINPETPAEGDTVQIVFDVKIDDDWYLYSTDFDPNLGPMVTEFGFEPDPSFKLVGEIDPINPGKKYDSLWEGEYTYFKKTGQFIQKAVIKDSNYQISGYYTYQVCSDIDGKCIPFDEEFVLASKKKRTSN